ncbi:MAG TPA: TraB/GumN family protein, partial [Gammaproteobacteria bacterium]|nr:TraB/GumN family protein [Gammaproteobacteria bacterium]
ALWQRFGIQVPLETLKPWFAGLLLANFLSGTIGFNHQGGVDRQIWQATAPEKRRLLEGTEALDAFDAAPPSEQSAYLGTIAHSPEVITARFTRLYQHWQSSNVAGFEQELVLAKEQFPIMFTGLIDGRNQSWLPTIVDRAKQAVPALVLVGALHLVGESGIPALLTERGFSIGAA